MYKLGILGLGKMGSSILSGVMKSKLYSVDEVLLYDVNQSIIEEYTSQGFKFSSSIQELINNVNILSGNIVSIKILSVDVRLS